MTFRPYSHCCYVAAKTKTPPSRCRLTATLDDDFKSFKYCDNSHSTLQLARMAQVPAKSTSLLVQTMVNWTVYHLLHNIPTSSALCVSHDSWSHTLHSRDNGRFNMASEGFLILSHSCGYWQQVAVRERLLYAKNTRDVEHSLVMLRQIRCRDQ
jgi:hypothetical protein